MRAAGYDQRAMGWIDPPGIANEIHAAIGVQAHAGDHEQVRNSAIEAHARWAKVFVPLLKDDAGFLKAAIDHGRANGPHAGGGHSGVGKDKGKHSRAVIEGAGNDRDKIVFGRNLPQPLADTLEFPRPQKLVSAGTSWKFHLITIRERNPPRNAPRAFLTHSGCATPFGKGSSRPAKADV